MKWLPVSWKARAAAAVALLGLTAAAAGVRHLVVSRGRHSRTVPVFFTTDDGRGVPTWFMRGSGAADEPLDAWKFVSTPQAVVYRGHPSTVLAGILRDDHGSRLPFTAMWMSVNRRLSGSRSSDDIVAFSTDRDGYFVVYGPWSLNATDVTVRPPGASPWTSGRFGAEESLAANPGYPSSDLGRLFAEKNRDEKACSVRLLAFNANRAFYEVTVPAGSGFTAEGYRSFRAVGPDDWKPGPARPDIHEQPFGPNCSKAGLLKTPYPVVVVGADGSGVPGAVVYFYGHGGEEARITDDAGRCELEDWDVTQPATEKAGWPPWPLTVDAPSYGLGPVGPQPRHDQLTVVRMEKPAAVKGLALDPNGRPALRVMEIHYKQANLLNFQLEFRPAVDGSFTFNRIIPGAAFKIVGCGQTDYMVLRPGEVRDNVRLQWAPDGCLAGVVTDESGAVPKGIWSVQVEQDEFHQGMAWPPESGRFSWRVGRSPCRIRVTGSSGTTFSDYVSDWMQVEPGELRYLHVKVKGKR